MKTFAVLAVPGLALLVLTAYDSPGWAGESVPKSDLEVVADAYCRERRGADAGPPPKRFTSDGCTLWPDSEWRHCCIAHDLAYWCGGSSDQRAEADKQLQQCLIESGHPNVGALARFGTRVGGSSLLPTPWRWGYGWPWPESGAIKSSEPDD